MNERSPSPLNMIQRIVRKLIREFEYFSKVRFDYASGYYRYTLYDNDLYVKYRADLIDRKEHLWKCKEIYFKSYQPKAGDTIIDLGAGYGEEAAYLSNQCDNLNYLGFEILPSVYECLSNTLAALKSNGNYRASPFSIGSGETLLLSSQYKYASVSNTSNKGSIEAFSKTWLELKALYSLEKIQMFKMNIEGAEIMVLDSIDDFSKIERFAIECHDFRADRGHGEHFRTKKAVINKLKENGFSITETHLGVKGAEWADNWIHATRN